MADRRKVAECVGCGEEKKISGRGLCSKCYQAARRKETKDAQEPIEDDEIALTHVSVEMPTLMGKRIHVRSINGRLSERQGKALASLKLGAELSGMKYRGHLGAERRVVTDVDVVRVWLDLVADGIGV